MFFDFRLCYNAGVMLAAMLFDGVEKIAFSRRCDGRRINITVRRIADGLEMTAKPVESLPPDKMQFRRAAAGWECRRWHGGQFGLRGAWCDWCETTEANAIKVFAGIAAATAATHELREGLGGVARDRCQQTARAQS